MYKKTCKLKLTGLLSDNLSVKVYLINSKLLFTKAVNSSPLSKF